MSDSYTTYLNLTKPAVGASRDTWGTKLNANMDTLDELLFFAMPIGCILDFAGPQAPAGWLICDGRLISRITYSALFAIIGTYWGAGDGSTTFALPPTPGRAAIGPGTVIDQAGNQLSYSFAQRAGLIGSYITQGNLPNYAMTTVAAGQHSHGGATAPGGNHLHGMDYQGQHSHGGTTDGAGTHAHTASADVQGNHQHNAPTPGPNNVGGGPFNTVSGAPGFYGYLTDVQGNHAHNITVDAVGNHVHPIYADGNHAHNIGYSGNLQLGIYADGNHAHTVYLGGGGGLFSVMQPVLVTTKIIYAGTQAAPHLASLAAPQSQRRLSAPMRGSH